MIQKDTIIQDAHNAQDKLISSVKLSLNDAEALLREAAGATGERAAQLREQALASLKQTREALYDAQDEVLAQGRRAVRATDEYVHDNPWQAIGVAGHFGDWDACGKASVIQQWTTALPQSVPHMHRHPNIGHFIEEYCGKDIAGSVLRLNHLT